MAQAGALTLVSTDPATQFTAALAQNAYDTVSLEAGEGIPEKLGFVDQGIGAGRTVASRLRAIAVISKENLAWEIWLWGQGTFNASGSDPAKVFPLGRWAFGAADGVQLAGTGLYYYYSDANDHPYVDLDRKGKIHLMLVNRSVTGKSAGATGAMRIQLALEATMGW
ncbi:MAG: hypothetical protein LUO93_02470 [Methanomicrobiales archaeon]|nr:hypothetical protein [Methanomicrobiales archaeon]